MGREREGLQGRHAAGVRSGARPAVRREGAHRCEGERERRGQRRKQRGAFRSWVRPREGSRTPSRAWRDNIEGEPDGPHASWRRAAEQSETGYGNPPASWCEMNHLLKIMHSAIRVVLIF